MPRTTAPHHMKLEQHVRYLCLTGRRGGGAWPQARSCCAWHHHHRGGPLLQHANTQEGESCADIPAASHALQPPPLTQLQACSSAPMAMGACLVHHGSLYAHTGLLPSSRWRAQAEYQTPRSSSHHPCPAPLQALRPAPEEYAQVLDVVSKYAVYKAGVAFTCRRQVGAEAWGCALAGCCLALAVAVLC